MDKAKKTNHADGEMALADIEANIRSAERIYRVVQKWRISSHLHIKAKEKTGSLTPQQASFQTDNVLSHLQHAESEIAKVLESLVTRHQLWNTFFIHVKGIGPIISAQLIGEINIEKTPNQSALWSYAGLGASRICLSCGFSPCKGKKCPDCGNSNIIGCATDGRYMKNMHPNAFLKSVTYRAALQFLMCPDSFYRSIYDEARMREEKHNTPFMIPVELSGGYVLAEKTGGFAAGSYIKKKSSVGDDAAIALLKKNIASGDQSIRGGGMVLVKRSRTHVHFRALRIVRKLFLSHVFEMWHRVNGMDYVAPYAIVHGGCSLVVSPDEVVRHDSALK